MTQMFMKIFNMELHLILIDETVCVSLDKTTLSNLH